MIYSYNIESLCIRYVIIYYKVLILNMKYWNSDYYMFNIIIGYRFFFFLYGIFSYKYYERFMNIVFYIIIFLL